MTSDEQPNLTQRRESCPDAQPMLFEGTEGHGDHTAVSLPCPFVFGSSCQSSLVSQPALVPH